MVFILSSVLQSNLHFLTHTIQSNPMQCNPMQCKYSLEHILKDCLSVCLSVCSVNEKKRKIGRLQHYYYRHNTVTDYLLFVLAVTQLSLVLDTLPHSFIHSFTYSFDISNCVKHVLNIQNKEEERREKKEKRWIIE